MRQFACGEAGELGLAFFLKVFPYGLIVMWHCDCISRKRTTLGGTRIQLPALKFGTSVKEVSLGAGFGTSQRCSGFDGIVRRTGMAPGPAAVIPPTGAKLDFDAHGVGMRVVRGREAK